MYVFMTHDSHLLFDSIFVQYFIPNIFPPNNLNKFQLPLVLSFSQGIQPKLHHGSTLTPFLTQICYKTATFTAL